VIDVFTKERCDRKKTWNSSRSIWDHLI
jgi:hypothetical protein